MRILFATHTCYFDTHNGASVASRALVECLSRQGFSIAAITGTVLETRRKNDPGDRQGGRGFGCPSNCDYTELTDIASAMIDPPISGRIHARGVEVLLHKSPIEYPHEPDESEIRGFLELFEGLLHEFRPDVVLNFGGDILAERIRSLARIEGAAVVFALHNFNYRSRSPFKDVDAVIVPSRFAASYYRRTLSLECTPLPYLIDFDRARALSREPLYVTFVNPSYEKGVYVFARIAEELGRRRPDIPLLVVEGRGTERTLVDCGIDMREHGNVNLMSHTPDPRHFWGVTKIALLPSLWWENQPLVAVEAMINGIPVIGSDRGGIPEALGDAGIVLGIPPCLTPATRELPTGDEIRHWVKAIINLWDDSAWYDEMSRRAIEESRRWAPEVLEPQYVEFFETLKRRTGDMGNKIDDPI